MPDARASVDRLLREAERMLRDGDGAGALKTLARATRMAPEKGIAFAMLGSAFDAVGRADHADAALRRAAALDPNLAPDAFNNLGTLAERAGDMVAAADWYRKAGDLRPGFAIALNNLGHVLHKDGRLEEAEAAYRAAVRADAGFAAPLYNLGHLMQRLERPDAAAAFYARTLAIDSGHARARHLLAALRGGASGADAEIYAARLFDDFADRYDAALIDDLQYRGPRRIREALRDACGGEATRFGRALDLGCGTGLCGAEIRPFCVELIGSDLSAKMIEKARARGCYDALQVEPLLETLRHEGGRDAADRADLIAAADVFVYVGALEETFTAVSAALRPGGWFAFTIELAEGAGEGVRLRDTARYAHTPAYIRGLAADNELKEALATEAPLRLDGGESISGVTFVLRKTAI